jgi:hypothetical protein
VNVPQFAVIIYTTIVSSKYTSSQVETLTLKADPISKGHVEIDSALRKSQSHHNGRLEDKHINRVKKRSMKKNAFPKKWVENWQKIREKK